jgi:hypothetical protein
MYRQNRLRRFSFAATMILCIGRSRPTRKTTWSNGSSRRRRAATRAGVFTDIRPDCTFGPLPATRLATPPAHGSVTVKRGTLKATNIKQCPAIEVPAIVAFYRASTDYSGADDFELEISLPDGHKQRERVHVTVTKSSSAGGGV